MPLIPRYDLYRKRSFLDLIKSFTLSPTQQITQVSDTPLLIENILDRLRMRLPAQRNSAPSYEGNKDSIDKYPLTAPFENKMRFLDYLVGTNKLNEGLPPNSSSFVPKPNLPSVPFEGNLSGMKIDISNPNHIVPDALRAEPNTTPLHQVVQSINNQSLSPLEQWVQDLVNNLGNK